MASLLVHVDAARLRELLPEPVAGEIWLVGADAFAYPQLERLDEHSWLIVLSDTRCIAVVRNPRVENGAFVGGAALVSNRDLAHVLPRLGCADGDVATWAATPRVVTPGDLDLLRYELGIADDEAIDPVMPDDDRTRELRAAVWDDPSSDDARMVYADYLQDRGDPRGELVALQVTRARMGSHASDRERLLVRRLAPDLAQPLTPYLAPGFELARGFVAKCTVNDVPMPAEIMAHPAWRTVEDVSTTNFELLASPQLRATRVGLGGAQLVRLVAHAQPLAFETVVGIAPVGKSQRGVWLDEAGWTAVQQVGALAAVRVLSVNSGGDARVIHAVLRSPLGRQLHQLDAFIDLQHADPQRWRDAFDGTRTPLLTLRFLPMTPERGRRLWIGPEVLVGVRRTARLPHLIVQVADALGTESVQALVRFVAQLSRNIQVAELHDFGAPTRNGPLLERLRAMFAQVVVQPASARPLAP